MVCLQLRDASFLKLLLIALKNFMPKLSSPHTPNITQDDSYATSLFFVLLHKRNHSFDVLNVDQCCLIYKIILMVHSWMAETSLFCLWAYSQLSQWIVDLCLACFYNICHHCCRLPILDFSKKSFTVFMTYFTKYALLWNSPVIIIFIYLL